MGRGARLRIGDGSGTRRAAGAKTATDASSFESPREYWTGILIGYLAAVLTSVGLMLTFMRHGW